MRLTVRLGKIRGYRGGEEDVLDVLDAD